MSSVLKVALVSIVFAQVSSARAADPMGSIKDILSHFDCFFMDASAREEALMNHPLKDSERDSAFPRRAMLNGRGFQLLDIDIFGDRISICEIHSSDNRTHSIYWVETEGQLCTFGISDWRHPRIEISLQPQMDGTIRYKLERMASVRSKNWFFKFTDDLRASQNAGDVPRKTVSKIEGTVESKQSKFELALPAFQAPWSPSDDQWHDPSLLPEHFSIECMARN
jgi:hypothetical protein